MSRTALLIEDNDQNRYLVTYLLESAGWHVLHAADGPAGVRLAAEHAVDLVLLDIQLPGLDGYAVARQLRQLDNVAEVPIVAVTSFAMAGDRTRALEAGCTHYVEKPIDPAVFVATVESCLPGAA